MNKDVKEESAMAARLERTYGRLNGYMASLPVLGFNSAKYDINLVKEKLAKCLNMHQQEYGFVVKQANAYSCIATDTMKFLDISHFLAPGTSYARFLKAYGVEERKGFMPYEWLDDVDQTSADGVTSHRKFPQRT